MTSTKRWRRPRSTTVHLPARLLKTSAKENAFARVRHYVPVASLIARIADGVLESKAIAGGEDGPDDYGNSKTT